MVVITYNHERYISQCLNSIVGQRGDYKLHIIINNDASTDDTDDIISAVIHRTNDKYISFDYQCNEQNIGFIDNFLDALSRAKGEYIAFCEGDDAWLDVDKLQLQLQLLKDDEELVVCFHDAELRDENNQFIGTFSKIRKPIKNLKQAKSIALDELISSPLRAWHISTVLARMKAVPRELEWIKEHPIYDFVFQALIFSAGKNIYIPKCKTLYRKHEESVSCRPYDIGYYRQIRRMLEDMDSQFDFQYHDALKKSHLSNLYFTADYYASRDKLLSLPASLLKLILVRYSPYSMRDYLWIIKKWLMDFIPVQRRILEDP